MAWHLIRMWQQQHHVLPKEILTQFESRGLPDPISDRPQENEALQGLQVAKQLAQFRYSRSLTKVKRGSASNSEALATLCFALCDQ